MSGRRLLLVHAHPDDEVTGTGATMARYASDGAAVTLVTCTRGELGPIVADDLADLRDQDADGLGKHREHELAAALEALGVSRHHWLGGRGRWRDSGMVDTEGNEAPDAFANADLDDAAGALVAILRTERPHVVVTYDDNGGYGHPDHIMANRVTMAAVARAADPAYEPDLGPPWRVAKTYWTALPRSIVQRAIDAGFVSAEADLPPTTPDEHITAVIDGRDYHEAKLAAMAAHRSQVNLDDGMFAKMVTAPEFAIEHYVLVRGERGPAAGEHQQETDLFAGLAIGTATAT